MNIKWAYISEYKKFDDYLNYLAMWDYNIKFINYEFFYEYEPWKWQNLFIFPDLWSLTIFLESINFNYQVVSVSATKKQRIKNFFDIKLWKIKNIITTHGWIFQDWKNLQTIFVFDPYKWYYKNQQNPRYYLPDVVKQIKFFYNVKELYFVTCFKKTPRFEFNRGVF